MADNAFDQFDTKSPTTTPAANPFDQFDTGGTVTVTAKRGSGTEQAPNGLGSDWQNYLAGIGKTLVDQARGLGQVTASTVAQAIEPTRRLYQQMGDQTAANLLGQPDAVNAALKQAQTDAEARDAPLLGTKAGKAGVLTGYAAQVLAPGAALKATQAAELPALAGVGEGAVTRALLPQTTRGAIAQGAVQGAIQPLTAEQSDEARGTNAVIGGVAGGAGALIPRAVGAVVRGGRALAAPFTESGQASILADLARRFGIDGATITPSAIPGVRPTLAEATGSPNAANFQRSLMSQPGAQDAFAQRAAENNAARYGYLQNEVGTPESTQALTEARTQGTGGLYDLARTIDDTQRRDAAAVIANANAQEAAKATAQADALRAQGRLIPGQQQATEEAAQAVERNAPTYQLQPIPQIQALTQRPAFAAAVERARTLLQNQGRTDLARDPLQTLDGLQAVKLSLDDMANADPNSPLGQFGKRAVNALKNQFMAATNNLSPAFQAANQRYAELSAPITSQEVGQELLRRGTSAATDANGVPLLRPESLARAVQTGDTIAQRETGQANATLANTLTPSQHGAFKSVLADLARSTAAQRGSMPPGSPTVQNAISQNVLSSIGAVPGLQGLGSIGPLARVASGLDTFFKATNIPDQLQAKAREFVLNPTSPTARQILQQLTPPQRSALEGLVTPYAAQAAQTARTANQ